MQIRKTPDQEAIDRVTRTTFNVLPLLRKKLLGMDFIQSEHGMPMSHIQVLAMLSNGSFLSVTAISRRLGIAKPNITPLIDRLIEQGYVERKRNELDRRVVNVMLLPKGRKKIDEIYLTILEHVNESFGGSVQEKDIYELERALRTIETILGDEVVTLQA